MVPVWRKETRSVYMTLGDVINNLKQINCSKDEFKSEVKEAFKDYKSSDIEVGEIGKDFFIDKRFDIHYQVTFNHEGEPAVKMKVEQDDRNNTIKVLDAWV